MSNSYPAVVIGGPPHSGKSVLVYTLTQRLRELEVDHYVIRACPDGEGDFTHEMPPITMRMLKDRNKRTFTKSFVERVRAMLHQRHLPLLVDVGGRPTSEQQERLFTQCTHAILLAADEEGLQQWRTIAAECGLTVIAELHSSLTDPHELYAEEPILRGRIHGLERQALVGGPVVDRLVQLLQSLLSQSKEDLRHFHLSQAKECTLDVERLARHFQIPNGRWQPSDVPRVLEYLSAGEPLSVYGRNVNWLCAAIVLHCLPAPVELFDVRLGWVALPVFDQKPQQENNEAELVTWRVEQRADHLRLEIAIADYYLDYDDAPLLRLPQIDPSQGLVLSGQIPHWLLVATAIHYRQRPWVAVFQSQLDPHAVVVSTQSDDVSIGSLIYSSAGAS